jgi:hypothetical protein
VRISGGFSKSAAVRGGEIIHEWRYLFSSTGILSIPDDNISLFMKSFSSPQKLEHFSFFDDR